MKSIEQLRKEVERAKEREAEEAIRECIRQGYNPTAINIEYVKVKKTLE